MALKFTVHGVQSFIKEHRKSGVISIKHSRDMICHVHNYVPSFLPYPLCHCFSAYVQVFIMNGRVHIIPKPRTPAEISRYPVATPTISEALRLVRSESIPTEASQQVQSCIEDRIGRYAVILALHSIIVYSQNKLIRVSSRIFSLGGKLRSQPHPQSLFFFAWRKKGFSQHLPMPKRGTRDEATLELDFPKLNHHYRIRGKLSCLWGGGGGGEVEHFGGEASPAPPPPP